MFSTGMEMVQRGYVLSSRIFGFVTSQPELRSTMATTWSGSMVGAQTLSVSVFTG